MFVEDRSTMAKMVEKDACEALAKMTIAPA